MWRLLLVLFLSLFSLWVIFHFYGFRKLSSYLHLWPQALFVAPHLHFILPAGASHLVVRQPRYMSYIHNIAKFSHLPSVIWVKKKKTDLSKFLFPHLYNGFVMRLNVKSPAQQVELLLCCPLQNLLLLLWSVFNDLPST